MIIPKQTKSARYYVALSDSEAYSSWASYEEAVDCISRFEEYNLTDYLEKIKGIVKVECDGRKWVKIL